MAGKNGSDGAPLVRGISKGTEALLKSFMRLPLIDRWHPWLREDRTDMRWLPINEDIRMPENTPMPIAVLESLIDEASHRIIVDHCGCRKAFKCEHYPVEIGCLLMGDSALEARGFPFREVGADEARAHAHRAVEAGLVPIVGKARADNFIFKIKDRHRLLSVCFCCECCCITRFASYVPVEYLEPTFPPLESLTIRVTDKCKGCGKCAEHCFVHAIQVVDTKAVIDDTCRSCGRCATFCPTDAIEIEITDPEFVEKTRERIRSYVKYE